MKTIGLTLFYVFLMVWVLGNGQQTYAKISLDAKCYNKGPMADETTDCQDSCDVKCKGHTFPTRCRQKCYANCGGLAL